LDNIIIDKKNNASLNWYLNMPLFNIGKLKITLLTLLVINIIILLLSFKQKNYKILILLLIVNILSLIIILSMIWIKY